MTTPRPAARRVQPQPPPPVRVAEPRDVPRIAATLTLAVAGSRWARWALPDDGRVQRLTRWHELDAGHRGVGTRTAWVTEDVASVAVWQPPDGVPATAPLPDDVRAALGRELPYLSAHRAAVVSDTEEAVAAARPGGPHWWLRHLGTRPSSRRQGLAAAVLAPALGRCDADGLPAAAAAYSWAAVNFLRGHGFEVAAALRTADDAMPVWVVVRAPR
ncbi:N-acetyltransferase [Geodermatophilus sp. YIM 151500]|uniref:N-acetyltransferase n=1 Tax=Geodermatophilus sp. YIM 151500 TaxID=2984531 RepID=UPI0021E3A6A4|nr:N-acetyltransferase [Geodermatophilus sp. YIM 151500]MCV2491929.1 N-acetyltransferase [Geodermatophilus sp. YIM 151500]